MLWMFICFVIHVTDVFVLFGFAFLVYFAINFTLSCLVRRMHRRV